MINRKAPVIQNVPEQSELESPLGISTSQPEIRCDPIKRRKKRWKISPWTVFAFSAALCVTLVQSHITSEGVNQVKFLTSDMNSGTFQHLDDDDDDLSSNGVDVLRDDVSKSTHFNGSRSSRLLKSLQTTFERHFKATLLCDYNDIIFNSSSGSIVVQSVTLDSCKNLSSVNDVFDIPSFDASKYRDNVKNLTVTHALRLTRFDIERFRSLRQLILRQNGIITLELKSILPNLEILDLSENPMTQFTASDVISVAPSLKTLILSNCSNLERIEFTNSIFLDEKLAPGLLVSLDNLVLDDNPNLSFVCSWFLRSAPNLSTVSLKNCPRLEIEAGVFVDRRFFPSLTNVASPGTPLLCDCALFPGNKSHVNGDLAQRFRDQLERQKVCRHNSSSVNVDSFLNDAPVACQVENEVVLNDHNPTLELSYFDPYIEPEENATLPMNQTYLEIEDYDGRVPVWNTVVLDCQSDNEAESVFWVTPTNAVFLLRNKTIEQDSCQPTVQILNKACGLVKLFDNNDGSNVQIFDNGTLRISDFGYSDRGSYECFVSTGRNRAGSARIDLGLDPRYRNDIYNLSLIYGFAVCGAFLLLTLLFKLIHFLLHNYGCCLFCCCCENKLPPKARRLKRALDSIEAYRSQQLDKLRENYTQQSDWIRENCASQMERVRDNYNTQIQNLKDIRQYGSTQLGAVRGQYYEQMSRIRDYSANQLDRVYENYIFQRQRLRKFSAQNYLRVQETGIYTRRTLTKVMENIPLYLDLTTCRQGLGERQTSLEWTVPEQLLELEPFPNPIHRAFLQREQSEHRSESIYFTPTGTPVREVFGSWAGAGQSNSLKNTPSKDFNPYKAVYSATGSIQGRRPLDHAGGHRRNKSWSQFLPPLPTWLATNRDVLKINEVEVVIEHETTGDDYYIDVDVSPTASKNSDDVVADSLTQSSRQSLRRCASVPSNASMGKESLASSSGVESMESGNTPQQQQLLQRRYNANRTEEEVPLLQANVVVAKSVTCLFPEGDGPLQKRLSI